MNKLDNIDRKILQLLQKDCRITIKDLSEKMHLSSTPVYERVKKLERSGIIENYVAVLNPKKIDRDLTVFIEVSLVNHTKRVVDKFMKDVLAFPEVMEFYFTAGTFDSLIKIMVKDMSAFQSFVQDKLSEIEYVTRFKSTFIISSSNKLVYDIKE